MKFNYTLLDKKATIVFEGKKIFFFNFIDEIIEHDDGLYVLFEQNNKNRPGDIAFINSDGTVRWYIDPLVRPDDLSKMRTLFDCKAFTINGITIYFPWEINRVVEHAEGAIVKLKAMSKMPQTNIFFVNNDGTVRWQIESELPEDNPMRGKGGYAIYTWVGFNESNQLEVVTFNGGNCKLDINTGKIYDCVYERF